MSLPEEETEDLLRRAAAGEGAAREQLLARHRDRLRHVVAMRLDRRLAPRVDPSDVVQETLAEAARRLTDYLRQRPLPFYPWLRQIAWDRLIELHRQHIHHLGGQRDARAGASDAIPDASSRHLEITFGMQLLQTHRGD